MGNPKIVQAIKVSMKIALVSVLVISLMPSLAFGNQENSLGEPSSDGLNRINNIIDGNTAINSNTTEEATDDITEDNVLESEKGAISSEIGANADKPDVDLDSSEPQNNDDIELQATTEKEGVSAQSKEVELQVAAELAEGDYYISSSLNPLCVLDVSGASKGNSANVQLYSSNVTGAQQWKITIDEKGYATITNRCSGKVLDVSGAQTKNGTNVQQYTSNQTKAQKWVISKDEKGYIFTSALSSKMALDVNGAWTANGTNIQIYKSNDTKAQRFLLTNMNVKPVSGEKCIDSGSYTIKASYTNKVIDIAGASNSNGANAQTYEPNGTYAQSFQFLYDSNSKCYTIKCLASGKLLEAKDANPISGANVQQWSANGSDAQKWAITKSGDTYTFINRATGRALDVAGASTSNGANVRMRTPDSSNSQTFTIASADLSVSGVYLIRTALSDNKLLDVPGASTGNNTQIQIYESNNTISQKFIIKREGNSTISIRSLISGLRLADMNGKLIQQKESSSDSQKWVVSYLDSGFVLKNKATGKVMDVIGASTGNGTKVQTTEANNSKAQCFIFNSTDPVNDACYLIQPACSEGKYLDFDNACWNNGTNLKIWAGNNSNAQKFDIIGIGNGFYRITSNLTWSNIDVAGGSKANGANVQMYDMNNTGAQKWRVVVTEDGWFSFQNASGKYLDVSGGENANGTNIDIYQGNGTSAQKFRLSYTSAASISGNSELDSNLRNTIFSVGKNGDILSKCYWRVASNSYARHGGNSSWGILSDNVTRNRALSMYRNGSGICYDYASQFMWLARALGYSANVRSGGVPSVSGGVADHGWTEIYLGGTRVCDPDLQHEIPGPSFYWRTYADAPVEYYL